MYVVSASWEFKQCIKKRSHVNYLGQMLYILLISIYLSYVSYFYFALGLAPPPPRPLVNNRILI
jgi:hypothetical protein